LRWGIRGGGFLGEGRCGEDKTEKEVKRLKAGLELQPDLEFGLGFEAGLKPGREVAHGR
jgi:hypothetical protein